jgi:hypothetical protein
VTLRPPHEHREVERWLVPVLNYDPVDEAAAAEAEWCGRRRLGQRACRV